MADEQSTPVSEMGVRVARAILLARPFFKPHEIETAITENWPIWWQAVTDARAAIAAMREPTDEMAAVGFKVEEERYAAHHPQDDGCAGDCWRAMNDAALGE